MVVAVHVTFKLKFNNCFILYCFLNRNENFFILLLLLVMIAVIVVLLIFCCEKKMTNPNGNTSWDRGQEEQNEQVGKIVYWKQCGSCFTISMAFGVERNRWNGSALSLSRTIRSHSEKILWSIMLGLDI